MKGLPNGPCDRRAVGAYDQSRTAGNAGMTSNVDCQHMLALMIGYECQQI